MRTLTCPANTEVIGKNVLAILENLQADEIRPYAEKHGLTDIDPDQWYPAQSWLDLMNDLGQHTNFMQNLVAIGMVVAEKVPLPPDLTCFKQFLGIWDHVYHKQHRGGEIGHHHVKQVDDNHFEVTFTDMYPDLLKYGIAHGFARRLLPKGTHVTIRFDEETLPLDKDGDSTIMYIKW